MLHNKALLGRDGGGGSADLGVPQHIVVVDNDPAMRALITRLLREQGHDVHGAADCIEFYQIMEEQPIGLIVMETELPQKSGFVLCEEVRARSMIPIIFVSTRAQEADRVMGLDLGADDYLPKPFGREELAARVRAVLRRTAAHTSAQQDSQNIERYRFGDWHYDVRRGKLHAPTGVEVSLTTAEHALLLALLRNPQRTIPRGRLLEMSSARTSEPNNRSIDVLVSRLRRKLSDGRSGQPMVRSIRGVGYFFTPEVVSV